VAVGRANHVWDGHSCPPHLTFLLVTRKARSKRGLILGHAPALPIAKAKSKAADKSVRLHTSLRRPGLFSHDSPRRTGYGLCERGIAPTANSLVI
jgi:hypothetical protein